MLDAATKVRAALSPGFNWWARLFPAPATTRRRCVEITYVGEAGLTLFGPVTGARYRFGWPGACLPVDVRDATDLLLREDLRMLGAAW